uniref:Transposase MuDR plant domain-containing protein n=1 Tax=Lactuca sativa TaxID=4236 RepID=A0A9R1UWQ8_LACSA|nr:hypothetical protein LSAT_V11C700348760 [Lactuca sativa]
MVLEKFQIKVEKSSKSRYQVVCMQENYHWRLYASLIKGTEMFEIKTFNDEHTCSSLLIHPNHSQANNGVLGTIIHDIMGQGSLRVWKPNDIIRDMNVLLQINIKFALGLMMGTPEGSFSKLQVYFHNMKKHNPGTVAYIKTDSEDRFECCFFVIGCAIRAFRECCRKVIIINGAHLKGKYKDTILHAVAMDGNSQILLLGVEFAQKRLRIFVHDFLKNYMNALVMWKA